MEILETAPVATVPIFSLRNATPADIPQLKSLIHLSVKALHQDYYSADQITKALERVYGVDTQLIADGNYFVVEATEDPKTTAQLPIVVGCGGWSHRSTLYGGDQFSARSDNLLDPAKDAAKIRAFFVHPSWVRKGIAGMILRACENAARGAGYKTAEMGATLSGVPFYAKSGYVAGDRNDASLGDGLVLEIVKMIKTIG